MQEIDLLKTAMCEYASQKPNAEEVLRLLCSKSKSELPAELFGSWPKIAECLPYRTVQSCHNVCRRRFNPDNYSGKWTKSEEEALVKLVQARGNAWKEITEEFNK